MSLQSVPLNVWRSEDFDCEKVFNEIFSTDNTPKEVKIQKPFLVDAFNKMSQIQDEIKCRIDENTKFFSTQCSTLAENRAVISSSVTDLSTILELESERMDGSLEKAKGFTQELQRIAGDVINLASERRTLAQKITKRRQFQMINNCLDQIDALLKSTGPCPDYKELSNLLLATEQLLQQYQNSPKSSESAENNIEGVMYRLGALKQRMSVSVLETFNSCIDASGKLLIEDPTALFGCCVAADVLESNLRAEIIRIYLDKQFSAYRSLHPTSVNVLELKTLEKRFKWVQRMLSFYEKTFKFAFPSEWQVEILLGQAMGNWIKEDIVTILASVPQDRRVSEDIFTQALSDANSFDRYIALRFRNSFNSNITQAFQDFHYFLFEAKEEEFIALKKKLLPSDSVKNISRLLRKDQLVLCNFDQFFLFFSGVLDTFIHLSSMSSGVLLVQFSFFLSDCLDSLNQYIESQFEVISALASKKWTAETGRLLCCLVNTVDYCITSSQDQGDRICQNIRSEDLRLQINLDSIQQKFLVTRSLGLSALLARFDSDLQIVFTQYTKIDWIATEEICDPSMFYMKIVEALEKMAKFPLPQVIQTLQPQTCKFFLEKLLSLFMTKLSNSMFKFKIVNELAAEQMMIDLFGFRSYFSQGCPPSNWKAKELAIWSQDVIKLTDKYEIYLKVLLTPTDPVGPFVQSYLLLLTDFNCDNFRKFLDIKGITRKGDQDAFIEEFRRHLPPTPSDILSLSCDEGASNASHSNSASNALNSMVKTSLNFVNAIKRTYTRPIENSSSDGIKY